MQFLMVLFVVSRFFLVSSSQVNSGGVSTSLSDKLLMCSTWSVVPAPSPAYQGYNVAPRHRHQFFPRHHLHHHRHRHRLKPYATSPTPNGAPGCDQTSSKPRTPTPLGTPCGCVVPMKVRILLSIAVYTLFPEVNELEIEIAAGTYLKQGQVQIVGATADSQNQERTLVDINLVPLSERFDKTTAMLTYERLQHKEIPLNRTLFGSYDVVYVNYPGILSPFPSGGYLGSGPTGSSGDQQYPINANFIDKNKKMSSKVVFVIVFSAVVVLVACLAAISILVKWKKVRKSSIAVGPVFTPSINKRSGYGSTLSSSLPSSTTSLFASMPTCALSVRTFSLAEVEKATDKFSSSKILGEGGFGRVYHGTLEEGIRVAVKLLTRDNQNGDREFIAEVEILSWLHHRNLVKLVGMYIEGHRRCLVYELVHNGSVESHLHGTLFIRLFQCHCVL